MEDTFTLDHEDVVSMSTYYEERVSEESLASGQSGPYGPIFNEAYGDVWAYTRDELPI